MGEKCVSYPDRIQPLDLRKVCDLSLVFQFIEGEKLLYQIYSLLHIEVEQKSVQKIGIDFVIQIQK